MKNVYFFVSLLFLTACAGGPKVIDRIPFNPAEFARLPTSGTATVMGQAFLKTSDGVIRYPQNEQARLNPKTSYSRQWYKVNYLGRQNIAQADPRYLKHVHRADIDPQGRFEFKNIPAGDYYLSAPIFWMAETRMDDGSIVMKRIGKFICYEIHVADGDTVTTNITTEQPGNLASSN